MISVKLAEVELVKGTLAPDFIDKPINEAANNCYDAL
jgi:hypothetical protein